MAHFTLELDTTAPVVTFGPPSNTDAGETLTVPFLINEPDCISARLELLDGRVLDAALGVGVVTVDLPADTPDGLATLILAVRDEVLNETDCPLTIPLTGVAVRPPRTYPTPGESIPSLPATPREYVHVRSARRVRTRVATSTVRVARSTRLGVGGRTSATASHAVNGPLRTRTGAGVARSGLATATPVAVVTSHELSRLREGPQTEVEIAAILGLL